MEHFPGRCSAGCSGTHRDGPVGHQAWMQSFCGVGCTTPLAYPMHVDDCRATVVNQSCWRAPPHLVHAHRVPGECAGLDVERHVIQEACLVEVVLVVCTQGLADMGAHTAHDSTVQYISLRPCGCLQ